MDEREEKRAPVQGYAAGIPWSLHMEAYDAYCKRHGPQKELIEGWCRGGFSVEELDRFIPGWRERISVLAALRAQLAAANERAEQAERERDEVKLIHDLKQVALEELQEVSERERDQLAAEKAKLREALARAGAPLEVLVLQIVSNPYTELSATLQDEIVRTVSVVRAALAQAPEQAGEQKGGEA